MTSIRTQLLRPLDPEWASWLIDVPHDIFHTAAFHAYSEASGEGTAYLAVIGDRHRGLAWPYLLRNVAEVPELAGSEATDVTSVYGYPGPLSWGCAPGDSFLRGAWEELLGLWREQRVVGAFTRFHPLLGNVSVASGFDSEQRRDDDIRSVELFGQTVSINCEIDDEAARADYHKTARRAIGRAQRKGFTTSEDVHWESLGDFTRLYRETMLLNQASPYYFFSASDFQRLRHDLADHVHLLVTRSAADVVASGVVLEFSGIVHTFLSASDRSVRPSPKPLFYDDTRRWARTRGNRVLHLGGGRRSQDDSLLEFKGRFSSRRHPFHVGRWVVDGRAYDELVETRMAGIGASRRLEPGFFPVYRAAAIEPPAQNRCPAATQLGERSIYGCELRPGCKVRARSRASGGN